MKLLGVETSSPLFSAAVCDEKKILSFVQVKVPTDRPSTHLTELIDEALRKARFSLESLDGFAISIGPGSFTGLRVGVMTVKTLSWALKKPVLSVSSLEVTARNLEGAEGVICPLLDARKGKVYMALFSSSGNGSLERLVPDQLLPPEEALKKIPPGALILGDGAKRYQVPTAVAEEKWLPRADTLCAIAVSRWPEGCLADPHRLVPQYLYSKESDVTGW